MPDDRFNSGACRLGLRIYVLAGEKGDTWNSFVLKKSILCFDLLQERWIGSGCEDFPGIAHQEFAVVALNDSTILVAGGTMYTRWLLGTPFGGTSREVFSLNIISGVWTQLADLPEGLGDNHYGNVSGFLLKPDPNSEPTIVIMCEKLWAQLTPSGEWEAKPDLHRFGLAIVCLDMRDLCGYIFTGNSWRAHPHADEVLGMNNGWGVRFYRLIGIRL